ncbi:ERF family protein [Clostridium rectalis]|uniref:ERF family protein n=1 Tax=Clostridium rectalis TaxID=2040295 RepID=UPI000F63C62A|nr:ERF family protein [Clostridium rectalis]
MNVYEKLMNVQTSLKAPKSQYNSFGKYNYRSCEDILESLKPLLKENKAIVSITDEVIEINNRFYIKATATFIDIEKGEKIQTSALAREDETKKGMDLAQVTGSVSSYARKYALNGLFAIDDNKDSDTTNNGEKTKNKPNSNKKTTSIELSEAQIKRLYAIAYSAGISRDKVKDQVKIKFNKEIKQLTKSEYDTVCNGYEKLKAKEG